MLMKLLEAMAAWNLVQFRPRQWETTHAQFQMISGIFLEPLFWMFLVIIYEEFRINTLDKEQIGRVFLLSVPIIEFEIRHTSTTFDLS